MKAESFLGLPREVLLRFFAKNPRVVENLEYIQEAICKRGIPLENISLLEFGVSS